MDSLGQTLMSKKGRVIYCPVQGVWNAWNPDGSWHSRHASHEGAMRALGDLAHKAPGL